jgi:hypothetical protein
MYEYLVRYKGYSSTHDEWVRSDEVEASRFKRKIRSMPKVVAPTGAGIASGVVEDFFAVPSLDSCLQFFGRVGGRFMKVVDEVLGRLADEETFSWRSGFKKWEERKRYRFE